MVPVMASTVSHGYVADQNAGLTRAFDVTATKLNLLESHHQLELGNVAEPKGSTKPQMI